MGGPKKTKVLVLNRWRVPKETKQYKKNNQAMGSENLRLCDAANLRIVDSGNFVCIQKRYLKIFCLGGGGDEKIIVLHWYKKDK